MARLIRLLRFSLPLILVVTLLGGCASSHVVVGRVAKPIPPDQVKIYWRPPALFDEVALLEASSRGSWAMTSQQKMNKVIKRLRAEAAKLGANGVLLVGTGSEYAGSVASGYATATPSGDSVNVSGFGGSTAIVHKTGSAIAIYVYKE